MLLRQSSLTQKFLRAYQERDRAVEHATSGDERNYKLQRQLLAEKEAREKAEAGQIQALRDISRLKRVGNSRKVSDSTIQETWGQLSFAIKNLAHSLANSNPTVEEMEGFQTVLGPVLMNEPGEIDTEEQRQLMIQTLLWSFAHEWWCSDGEQRVGDAARAWKSLRNEMARKSARMKKETEKENDCQANAT